MPLAPRDLALLAFLDRTPATATQIVKVSVTFGKEPFRDERRVRERMQALARLGLVRSYSLAVTGGGLANYYKLTAEGYRIVHGADVALPHRSFFADLSPSRLMHTLELADAIVHALVAAHASRIRVTNFHRENELLLETGSHRVTPDCHVQFYSGGKLFNVLVELDRSTESLDSNTATSIRTKLLAYEAYQDYVSALWKQAGKRGPRSSFRVAFLTATVERAYHILALARSCASNPDRRLCYAAAVESFLGEPDAVRAPIFLDHHGHWQALVNLHPSAPFTRTPVRIAPHVQLSLGL
jgi:hypothetical protein